jgi:hypothetical protein
MGKPMREQPSSSHPWLCQATHHLGCHEGKGVCEGSEAYAFGVGHVPGTPQSEGPAHDPRVDDGHEVPKAEGGVALVVPETRTDKKRHEPKKNHARTYENRQEQMRAETIAGGHQ